MKQKEYSLVRNWNYIGISVVLFAVITLLVLYLPNMRQIDSNILESVRLALSPYPLYIPIFVSEFGRAEFMLWPQIAAACTLVSHRYYLKAFMLVLFTQLAFFTNQMIKEYICRPRPDGAAISGFSFPSNHAMTSMCFCGIIMYLIHVYVHNRLWRNCLMLLFGLWTFMCGVSRLWLGVHFLSDVVAGWLAGFVLVNLYIIIDKSVNR